MSSALRSSATDNGGGGLHSCGHNGRQLTAPDFLLDILQHTHINSISPHVKFKVQIKWTWGHCIVAFPLREGGGGGKERSIKLTAPCKAVAVVSST